MSRSTRQIVRTQEKQHKESSNEMKRILDITVNSPHLLPIIWRVREIIQSTAVATVLHLIRLKRMRTCWFPCDCTHTHTHLDVYILYNSSAYIDSYRWRTISPEYDVNNPMRVAKREKGNVIILISILLSNKLNVTWQMSSKTSRFTGEWRFAFLCLSWTSNWSPNVIYIIDFSGNIYIYTSDCMYAEQKTRDNMRW